MSGFKPTGVSCCPFICGKTDPDHGRVMIPALKRLVSFRKVRTDSEGKPVSKSGRGAPSLLTSQSAAKPKVRIEWNLDIDHAQAVLERGREEPTLDARDLLRKRTRSLHSIKLSDDSLHTPPQPAYEDGQSVEYYSVTHCQWMSGTIATDVRSDKSQQAIYYNVTLTQGRQLRVNVDLDLLRTPLSPGDAVEYVSDDQYQRQPALVLNQQRPAPTMLGYRVEIEGSGKILERVPASRLRRRFCHGQNVEVYRGAELGWQEAIVHHTASTDGCAAEVLPVPAPPYSIRENEVSKLVATSRAKATLNTTHQNTPRQSTGTPQQSMGTEATTGLATTRENGPWTMVPICEDFHDSGASPEMVPSCLVRSVAEEVSI